MDNKNEIDNYGGPSLCPASYDPKFCELKYQFCRERFLRLERELSESLRNHKEDILRIDEEYRKELEKNHNDILEDIKKQISSVYVNLKDKIVVSDNNRKEDISSITEFNDDVKKFNENMKKKIDGNGEPGIIGEIRDMKKTINFYATVFGVLCILLIGGEFIGMTLQELFKKILHIDPPTKQVDEKTILKAGKDVKKIEPNIIDTYYIP